MDAIYPAEYACSVFARAPRRRAGRWCVCPRSSSFGSTTYSGGHHMSEVELSQLAITPAETDADLEAMIHVRSLVTPEARPTVENLRFNLDSKDGLTYLVGRIADEAVACAYVEAWTRFAVGDVAVVPELRGRGIGSEVLAEVSRRARDFGKDSIQGEIKESDAAARAFL